MGFSKMGMYEDFIQSNLKLGFSAEEVLKMLGTVMDKPDKVFEENEDEIYLTDEELLENGFFKTTKKGKKIPQYYELTRYLINVVGCKSYGAYTWIYDDGYYQYYFKEMLDRLIIKYTKENANPAQLNSFIKILVAESQVREDKLMQPEGKINLENCVLDVKTKKIENHSIGNFFKYKLPHRYDADATCPKFEKYLEFVFQGNKDLCNVTFEIFGYCLYGGDPFLHKAFVLYGDGRNGKSVWLHILRKLLGDDNTSSVSMGLLNRPFSAVQLDGKLANITGELPTGKLDSESFKTAVGGEYLTASFKGKDEFSLKCDARLVFAANNLPIFGDATTGMHEKLFIMPFNRYIDKKERDIHIFKKLESEIPGILNKSLEGLERLLKRGRLEEIGSVKDAIKEYRKTSDSVYDWASENLIVTSDKDDKFLTRDLYNAYVCDRSGDSNLVKSDRSFGKRLFNWIKSEIAESDDKTLVFGTTRENNVRGIWGLKYKGRPNPKKPLLNFY